MTMARVADLTSTETVLARQHCGERPTRDVCSSSSKHRARRPPAGLRRDSSVHDCQRGELSVRGLARTRLKRVAIRTNVNDGFNEFDRPVTLRNLDLSGPDHTDR